MPVAARRSTPCQARSPTATWAGSGVESADAGQGLLGLPQGAACAVLQASMRTAADAAASVPASTAVVSASKTAYRSSRSAVRASASPFLVSGQRPGL